MSTEYEGRDETCPVSTGKGEGGGVHDNSIGAEHITPAVPWRRLPTGARQRLQCARTKGSGGGTLDLDLRKSKKSVTISASGISYTIVVRP